MSETFHDSNHKKPAQLDLQFNPEIEIEESGFSFRPIDGFELEIDGAVYMYSEGGNIEIYMLGGKLEEDVSIAELNDELAADFMENVGDFNFIESGKDTLQGITGLLNEIRFSNAEEEGLGKALICSPFINQFFFILIIANEEYWQLQGEHIFSTLKSQINFQPQFSPEVIDWQIDKHPDLTIETFDSLTSDEDFVLTIEKGDVSFLLAARTFTADDEISITEILAPNQTQLYKYDPGSDVFLSSICDKPLTDNHGEVCFFYPRSNQQPLHPGNYNFTFATSSGAPVEEVHVIVRAGRALDLQKVNLNFWFAMENPLLMDQLLLEQFTADIHQSLNQRLAPFNLATGRIEYFQPAPDELDSFASINLDSDLADCSYMISESINNGRALNVGLVDEITQGASPVDAEVNAVSSGSPGMILTPTSPHACILIKWPAFEGNVHQLADAIIQQMIIFSGIEFNVPQQDAGAANLVLNREIAWRLRRHPLFYDAD